MILNFLFTIVIKENKANFLNINECNLVNSSKDILVLLSQLHVFSISCKIVQYILHKTGMFYTCSCYSKPSN